MNDDGELNNLLREVGGGELEGEVGELEVEFGEIDYNNDLGDIGELRGLDAGMDAFLDDIQPRSRRSRNINRPSRYR